MRPNFNRPPRLHMAELPPDTVDIPSPPDLSDLPETQWWIAALPVLGVSVMAVFYLLRTAADSSQSAFFALPLLFLAGLTLTGTIVAQRWRRRDHRHRRDEQALTYYRLLGRKRARLQAAHDAQCGILISNFPSPLVGLRWALDRDARLWERRPETPDFAAFRVGMGRIPSMIRIQPPDPDAEHSQHPVQTAAVRAALTLTDEYRFLPHAPIILSLVQSPSVGIHGHRDSVMKLMRAVLCHLALTHAPQDLHLYIIAPPSHRDDWRWLDWLPHTSGGDYTAYTADDIRSALHNLSHYLDERKTNASTHLRLPHLVVVFDNPQLTPYLTESEPIYAALLKDGASFGASVLCIVGDYDDLPGDCYAIIDLQRDLSFTVQHESATLEGHSADSLSLQDAENLARALSAIQLREAGAGGRIPRQVDFLELYGVRRVEELAATLETRWIRDIPDGVLPFPVAIGRESLTSETWLWLDEFHHGPHGVLAGTTGAGKSELLQTLVCGLAIEHSPQWVNFLLIDFKGGSTFNLFADLPHTVGMVTNLDDTLIERTLQALTAEIRHRQQMLKQLNIRDITQYYRLYGHQYSSNDNQARVVSLPHLFVIVDEFAQLAREMPDFLRELVKIAQLGRSLGLHLILGTQSPSDVVTDEITANLQFKLCLRVQTADASRAVLHRPDAAYLPSGIPGRGYLQVGERGGVFKQFQTAYTGGDYPYSFRLTPSASDEGAEKLILELITDDGHVIDLLASTSDISSPSKNTIKPVSVAQAIVKTIRDVHEQAQLPSASPLLLPPLEDRLTLAAVFAAANLELRPDGASISRTPSRSDRSTTNTAYTTLRGDERRLSRIGGELLLGAPIGILDDLPNRSQPPLWVYFGNDSTDSTRKSGHLLIVGRPGSGKTTLLTSIALSLGMLSSPDVLHMYFMSFAGGGLNAVSDLPHAERAITGTEPERIRRLFRRLMTILNERQATQTIDLASSPSRSGYTSRTADWATALTPASPTIILFIDSFESFRDTCYEAHQAEFERFISEGHTVGMYVVLTSSTVSAFPERLRSLIPQRIALALPNRTDYALTVGQVDHTMIDRDLPVGRGFVAVSGGTPVACQIALPSFNPTMTTAETFAQTRSLVTQARKAYAVQFNNHKSQAPAPLRELPIYLPLDTLPLAELSTLPNTPILTTLGCHDDDALTPFTLDWQDAGSHFIVTGPPASGKTNLLQAAAFAAVQTYSPSALRLLLVDFTGRSLRPLEKLKHTLAIANDPDSLTVMLAHLEREVQALANTMHPPKTVLLMDNYDITAEALSSAHPALLRSLRDHARLHSDFGLSIWIAGYLERLSDPLTRQLLLRRTGFILSSREGLATLNVRTTGLSHEMMPPGRAYFARYTQIQIVQTAVVEDPLLTTNRINGQVWRDHPTAQWQYPNLNDSAFETKPYATGSDDSLDIDTAGLIDDLLGR